MKKPTVYVNPVYPQPERQTGTIWEQATKKKRAKYLIYKYLTLFLVPRPALTTSAYEPISISAPMLPISCISALIIFTTVFIP